jgi:hypothetical protein
MVERVLIPFEGRGSGVGELTWGQLGIWRAIRRRHCSMGVGGPRPLPPGATVPAVGEGLRFVMGRHQSLRTRLVFDPDGHVRQCVAGEGEVPLEIVDAADDEDPAAVADALRARYHATEFDYANEWPVRMAVVRHRGALTHVVPLYCHLALDGGGAEALVADLINMVIGGPVTAAQPLDLADWQHGPAGRGHTDRTLRYWARLLRDVPTGPMRRFAESTVHRTPRCREARFTSRATHLAVQAIAARTALDTSAVLLAAYAVALARVTGQNPVVTQLAVGNRFRPALTDVVSTVVQNGLSVIDVADVTFEEAAVRAWRSALGAYQNAYYDPAAHDELLAGLGRARGGTVDIGWVFDDRRSTSHDATSRPPTGRDIRDALVDTTLGWRDRAARPGEDLTCHVADVPDTTEMWVPVDTDLLSPEDTETFVREVEAVAVTAALDPDATTRIRSGRG